MRHAQKLEHLQSVLSKAEDAAATTTSRGGKKQQAPSASGGADGKRRATAALGAVPEAGVEMTRATAAGAVVTRANEENEEDAELAVPLAQRLAKRMRT